MLTSLSLVSFIGSYIEAEPSFGLFASSTSTVEPNKPLNICTFKNGPILCSCYLTLTVLVVLSLLLFRVRGGERRVVERLSSFLVRGS